VSLVLTEDEIQAICFGYTRQADQLRVLHERGFGRAEIRRGVLVLERGHYDAVIAGAVEASRPRVKPPRVKAPAL
jgi:hypothetical protein